MDKIANNKVLMAESSDIYHDYRVQKEASSLASAGYDVTVLGFRSQIHEQRDNDFNFNIFTLPVVSRNHRLLRNLSIAINILVINVFIVVYSAGFYHAHNTYFLLGMYIANKLHGGKFIYDAHEVQWEMGRIPAFLERCFIKKPDAVINASNGRKMAQAKRYGISQDNICVISNYPIVKPIEKKDITNSNNKSLRIIFSGGFNLKDNRLDLLLTSIKDFKRVKIDFLAFGYGSSYEKLLKLINEFNLEKVVQFMPIVKPENVISFLSGYDIAVNLLINPKNKISRRYSSSNKMYEYIAAGLPILCSNLETFIREFVSEDVAIGVDPNDVGSISKGLQSFINNPGKILEMRKKAVLLSQLKFNWSTQEKKLIEMYSGLSE